jgi:hypothetical protein
MSGRSSLPSRAEALSTADTSRCEAIADSTGERCQRESVGPLPYCELHNHLLDDVDLQQIGSDVRNPPPE